MAEKSRVNLGQGFCKEAAAHTGRWRLSQLQETEQSQRQICITSSG